MCCGGCNDKKLVLNLGGGSSESNCVWQHFDIIGLGIDNNSFLSPPSNIFAGIPEEEENEVPVFTVDTYFDGCSSMTLTYSMRHQAGFIEGQVDDRIIDFWNDLSALLPLLNGYTIDDLEINPLPAVITYYGAFGETLGALYTTVGDVWIYKSGNTFETYVMGFEPPIAPAKVAGTEYLRIGFQITLPVTKTS
jgi:hypothetical protein